MFYKSLKKYISPRNIKKIINIYALLKTGDVKKDLFLILAILNRSSNLIDVFQSMMSYFENKENTIGYHNKEEYIVLEPIECLKLFHETERIQRTTYGGASSNNIKTKKLLDLYSKYSIARLNNLDKFSIQFTDYLNTHLWEDVEEKTN